MGKRGPQSLGNTVELRVPVTPDVDEALNQLVAISGLSKAHLVRQMVLVNLNQAGAIYPDLLRTLTPTATRGRRNLGATDE